MNEEKKAARNERDRARRAALATIVRFAAECGNEEVRAAAAELQRRTHSPAGGKPKAVLFLESILPHVGAEISEATLFDRHKVGRAEMRVLIARAIRKGAESDRPYVLLIPGDGLYRLVARGGQPPADWAGPRPE